MPDISKLESLEVSLKALYAQHPYLLFHGWHHIWFVFRKSKVFAADIGADEFLVQSAALVHDVNYIAEKNSKPEAGQNIRENILTENGYSQEEVERVEQIVMEEHTATRNESISSEGKALSDADTLFKALPVTPILLAGKYIQENEVDIARLAEKIVGEQSPLMEKDIYFYTPKARGLYLNWAKVNLELWKNVQTCLKDEDVTEMLKLSQV
jgi:uncharacterized protein